MALNFPGSPSDGQTYVAPNGTTYVYDATNTLWRVQGGDGDNVVFVSATAPVAPTQGKMWWNSDTGAMYIWYIDVDGGQWVPAAATGPAIIAPDQDLSVSSLVASGDVQAASVNSGPLSGFRNQLINGDFRVRQFFNNGTGSNKYITDRWCTNDSTTGATPDVTDVNGAAKGLRLDAGSRVIRQVVELPGDGLAGPFYNGSQWTMSIYSTVAPDQLDVRFCEGGINVGTSAQITGVPGWTATSDVQGSFTRYTCTFNVNVNPDSTSKGFRVSWSFASAATFTLAQLEPGPVASVFEARPIQTELALCQRYYYRSSAIWAVVCRRESGTGTGSAFAFYQFPTTMRAVPSFVAAGSWYSASGTPIADLLYTDSARVATGATYSTSGGDAFAEIRSLSTSSTGHFTFDAEI